MPAPYREEQSDEESSGHSRRRHRQRSRHYDQDSVDSGYGGSCANASPQSPKKAALVDQLPSPPVERADGMPESRAAKMTTRLRPGAGREDADSDSDYDPRAKYYLTVDDDDYQNISFQGGEVSRPEAKGAGRERREREGESTARRRRNHGDRPRHSSHRRRSSSRLSSDTDSDSEDEDEDEDHRDRDRDSRRHHGRSRRERSSRRASSDASPSSRSKSRPRRQLVRHPLSPIFSDDASEDRYPLSSLERRPSSRARSRPRRHRRRRSRSSSVDDDDSTDSDAEGSRRHRRAATPRSSSRAGSRARAGDRRGSRRRDPSAGAADMDMAWYKTFMDRLTKGVDMKQVRKVGFEAAAVSAVKVAVGTQTPWKQRIPKTIAVGLAAAVTDFLVSRTGIIKPKGLLGTVFARQFVEIALANLIINPTSNKVQQTWKAKAGGSGAAAGRS